MVLRLPIRINRRFRWLAIWVVGLGAIYVVLNTLFRPHSSTEHRAAPDDGITINNTRSCVPRVGQNIAGHDRYLRPHLTVGRPPSPFPRLEAAPSLPLACLDKWIGHGSVGCRGSSAGSDLKMDVVWTWVNGSDPRWKEAMRAASQEEGIFSPGFHYR